MNTDGTDHRADPVMVYPPAVCPICGSDGAVLIPASQVGWLFDWVLCYGCGEVSVVNAANTIHGLNEI